MKTVWISLAFMVVSIIGNAVTSRFSKLQQTHAGYFMAANRRVSIGNRLKSVPMGFFNENSLGEVTGVCTTVLGNIENLVPMTLVNILGGRLRNGNASCHGAAVGIPPLQYWASNQPP